MYVKGPGIIWVKQARAKRPRNKVRTPVVAVGARWCIGNEYAKPLTIFCCLLGITLQVLAWKGVSVR